MKKPSYLTGATVRPWLWSNALTVALAGSVMLCHAEESSKPAVLQLINRLGAKSFVAREDAAQQLLEMGATAKQSLLDASKSNDREIRDRSKRILSLIEGQQRDQQITAFRNGKASNVNVVTLPGWEQFSERYGKDDAARDLYAKRLESEWELLTGFFSTPPSQSEPGMTAAQRRVVSTQRFKRLQHSRVGYQNYEIGTMLSFFFVANHEPAAFELHSQLYSFVRHRKTHELLLGRSRSEGAERRMARKIIGDWLVSASDGFLNERLALQTTQLYRLYEEGSLIAKRVLTNDDSSPVSKSSAMETIVLRGDKEQVALIEPFLKDKTRLSTNGKRERQLRDVALACLMELRGYDISKIGAKRSTNTTVAFDYNSIGFISESDREKAFRYYQTLRDKES